MSTHTYGAVLHVSYSELSEEERLVALIKKRLLCKKRKNRPHLVLIVAGLGMGFRNAKPVADL